MRIIGIVLWVMGLIWAIAQGINIREKAKNEQATEHTFELHALLLAVSVFLIPFFSLSPFHLLWMIPASFVLGLASMIPPLNLLWLPASLYGSLWYIGTKNPGRAFYLAGDYSNAIEAFKETLLVKPNSADTHFCIGLAYWKAENIPKAIESFNNTIRLEPNYAQAYCNLGVIYKDLENERAAADAFEAALRIRPNYPKVIWQLGMTYIALGELENAKRQHESLQQIDREHADKLHAAIAAAHGQHNKQELE